MLRTYLAQAALTAGATVSSLIALPLLANTMPTLLPPPPVMERLERSPAGSADDSHAIVALEVIPYSASTSAN